MNKHELRTLARAHRLNLSTEETQELNAGLRSLLFSRIPIHRYSIIHAFLPILKNKEPDTYPILNTLLKDFAADVYISKSLENGELLHFPFEADKTYALNRWGIPEPETTEDGLSSETFFDTFKKKTSSYWFHYSHLTAWETALAMAKAIMTASCSTPPQKP